MRVDFVYQTKLRDKRNPHSARTAKMYIDMYTDLHKAFDTSFWADISSKMRRNRESGGELRKLIFNISTFLSKAHHGNIYVCNVHSIYIDGLGEEGVE